jgi:hypothetical protein
LPFRYRGSRRESAVAQLSTLGGYAFMKTFTTFIFAVATLILTSCSKPQQSAIIGRWHEVGTPDLLTFHEDGTIEILDGQKEWSGKYSFITDSKLEIDVIGKTSVVTPHIYEIGFASDKMSWKATNVDGLKSEYLKVK